MWKGERRWAKTNGGQMLRTVIEEGLLEEPTGTVRRNEVRRRRMPLCLLDTQTG